MIFWQKSMLCPDMAAIWGVVAGATVDEVASATGWQRHTVRGVFSGTLKKELGLTLASAPEERGRVYRIAASERA
jgi:hypothetical protein